MLDIPAISNNIGILSGGLYMILKNHYQKNLTNKDGYIQENSGFILAHPLLMNIVDEPSIEKIARYITSEVPNPHPFDSEGYYNILKAVEFYSICFYHMVNTKKWTLPDRFFYNLTRPQTWDDFSQRLPIAEINCFEMIDLWIKIESFMIEVAFPQLAKFKH